jgi:hypothetical protein
MNGFTQHRDFDAGPYLNPGKRSTPSASRTVTTGGFGTNRALAVVDGSGDGSYCTGAFVGISADAAAPGTVFVCWTSSTPGVAFADHLSPHTSIFMPESAATVTATYRTLPGGGGGNTPPTISDVASRTINEDAVTGAIPVAIGDAETPAGGLLLTASSSNQALVPNANIVLGGSGANRTATITPVANQSGTAVIALTVTDVSGATASDTFLLTVTAVNDLPTIGDLEYLQMDEDTSTGAVVVDVGDLETSAGSLLLAASSSNQALVPNANIVLGGSGANRTLAITPAVNQSGTTTITVIVTDGNGATASDSFIVAVVAQNDPPSCTTAPWVTGVAMHGQTLGVTTGIWVDHDGTVAAYAYQWERADSDAGANTVLIVGAQMGTYQPTSEDVGKVLRVRVTATDDGAPAPGASAHAYSAYTAQISALGNLPPTIGDIADLTTGEDTVPGWIAVTVSDSESAAGSLVLAASSSDQTLLPDANIALGGSGENRTVNLVPAADRSGMVAVTLTVTDGDGATASRVFLLTVTAVNDAPVNTTPPSITGTTTQGQSLGGTTGDWHDPEGTVVSYARQWQRADDSGGANAASIPGATGSIYVLTAADVGKVLRLRVTATDHGLSFPAASTTAWSGWTAVVAAMPITATPVIDVTSGLGTATPTISGTATTGATIRIYEGSEHIATTQAGMDGSWEWQASVPLFAGWHSITFTATAVGHGESLPTAPITVSLAAHTIQVVPGSGGGGCGAGGLAGVMVSWLAVAGLLRRSRKDSAVSGRDP